jgi:hypothetical protein
MRFELVCAGIGLVVLAARGELDGLPGFEASGGGPQPEHARFDARLAELGLSSQVPLSTRAWYLGGHLHNVAASVWVVATPEDQLATAADWALAFPRIEAAVKASGDVAELLPFARALRSCVSQTAADELSSGRTTATAELAAVCGVMLHWVTSES